MGRDPCAYFLAAGGLKPSKRQAQRAAYAILQLTKIRIVSAKSLSKSFVQLIEFTCMERFSLQSLSSTQNSSCHQNVTNLFRRGQAGCPTSHAVNTKVFSHREEFMHTLSSAVPSGFVSFFWTSLEQRRGLSSLSLFLFRFLCNTTGSCLSTLDTTG